MPTSRLFTESRVTRGLTLLELMLVMVLLVVAFAMVVPQLSSVTKRRELVSGAEQVRAALTKARNQAMRSGSQIVLLYQPDTPFYASVPVPVDEESATQFEATKAQLTQWASVGEEVWDLNGWDSGAAPHNSPARRLPRDVRFLSPLDATSGISAATGTGMITGGFPAMTGDSTLHTVVFQPDGTAFDAQLDLRNAEGDRITLAVRGLTGIIRVGGIRLAQSDELLGVSSP